jgi:hypothetical protein
MPRAPRALLPACVALACAGCASPYVTVTDTEVAQHATDPMTLPQAIGMERAYHDKWRQKAIDLGDTERNLSSGLITLGGVLAGLAAAGASAGTTAGVAITGGTIYALGTFNTDKRRAQIYIAGMKALECADEAVLPYNFSQATQADLKARMAWLESESLAVTQDADRLRQMSAAAAGRASTGDLSRASATVAAAAKSATTAGNARTSAQLLLRQRDQIAERLRLTVTRIDKAVLDEIRGTEGSIQSVPGILAGLNANIGVFSAVAVKPGASAGLDSGHAQPAQLPPGAVQAPAPVPLADATSALNDRLARLDAASQQLTDLVTAINADARAAQSLADCQVSGPQTTMTITPASLSLTAGTATRLLLLPSGGKPAYSASFVQDPHAGLDIAPPVPGSDEIYVVETASPAAAPGTYQVLVKDTSGQKQLVSLTVAAGGASPPSGGSSSPSSGDAAKVVGMKVPVGATTVTITHADHNPDGSWSVRYTAPAGASVASADVAAALAAFPAFQDIAGVKANVQAAADSGNDSGHQIASKTAVRAAHYGTVAAGLSIDQARTVQRAICMPADRVDGLWGMRSQAALIADRERREAAGEKAVPQGLLTADEARALQARTAEQVAAACKP